MNPFILFLGLLGTGAIGRGFGKDKSAFTKGRDKNQDDEPEGISFRRDTTEETPETAPEEDGTGMQVQNGPAEQTEESPETASPTGNTTTTEAPENGGSETADTDDTGGETDTASPPAPSTEAPTTTSSSPTPTAPTTGTSPAPTTSAPTTTIPTAPTQTGASGADGAATTPISSQGSVDVITGRVATIQPTATDISGLSIVSNVQHGNVTVNPDNTFALVMTESNFTGSQNFVYEVTHSDGSATQHQIDLNVSSGPTTAGWGTGESHYMLATDANDDVIVEYGANHRAVYISGSQNALSLTDIAALEGLSVNQITGSWLANSSYGTTEGSPLDLQAGMMLWNTLEPIQAQDSSNWLMFERGYTYDNYGDLLNPGVNGESEMHPILIGAWGQGTHPVMQEQLFAFWHSSQNVVIQGLHFTEGVTFLDAKNIILDDLILTDDGLVVQNSDGITVRNSAFYDIKNTHAEGNIQNGTWMVDGNRVSGTYIDTVQGLLFEGNFYDQNGFSPDYALDASTSGGQPPIMFNHNVYIQSDNIDVTVRDTITMRAASIGMQVRSGGFVEDNVYIDNNVAGNFATVSNTAYTLFTDNLITDAGGRTYHPNSPGALSAGIDSYTALHSLVDNIVTHLADPNGAPTTIPWTDWSIEAPGSYYDDTIIYNWKAADGGGVDYVTEQNTAGLDTSVLDQTTIQLFAEQLLGTGNGTIDALATYLRDQANGLYANTVDADVIIDFFQKGFGIAPAIRTSATTLRFVPDDLGEGMRWDNRLNWDTDDLPGLYSQDSVDLGANHVVFGTTATIDTLELSGGKLDVYGGKLTATGGVQGESGTLDVSGAGQIWLDGSDGTPLDVAISGGRFANTGAMSGADMTVSGGGQSILATGGAEYDVNAGDELAILGSNTKVGFDGDDGGLAILDFQNGSTVTFAATDGDFGEISEFRSGAFGTSPNVSSGIDLGGSTLNIDLAGLSASAGTAFTLMSADELVGLFGNATVGGLGGRDANIVIDYQNDTVTLQLSSGSGAVSVSTVGTENDVSTDGNAVWTALTSGQGVLSNTQSAMVPPDDPLDDPLTDPLGGIAA